MISKKISDFANTISFSVKDDSAFGFINDFLISIYERGTKKNFFVYYYLDTDIPDSNGNPVSIMTVSGLLMNVFSKYNVTEYVNKENGLEVTSTLPYRDFYSLLKETINTLSSVNAIKKNICSECQKEILDNDNRFRISDEGINHLLCDECAHSLKGDENEDQENEISESNDTEVKISTFKGILGSILFSLGIAVCLVLLYAFVIPLPTSESAFKPGYYVNWLSSFLAFASFVGYKIFSKEPMGNKPILISGAISIIISLITQYISSIVLFSRESIFVFENLSSERFSKMIPYLLKIPFTDSFVSPDFKIYILMDIIFIILSLIVISFCTTPKSKTDIVIEKI